jgi:large subunit ribosomal protein L10
MALTRAKKTEKVNALAHELEHSSSAIIGTFKALTASKDYDLRKTVREAGGSYHVVKNKLAARSSKGTKIEAALQGLKGVSSVAYTSGDPVALAKALSTWVKDNSEFTFKLGIVDGKVITVEEISALATLPGKEELFSKLLFLIQSPAQRLATVINATGRDLAIVINQGVEKGKFAGPAAAPAAEAPAAEAPAAEAPTAEAPTTPAAEAPTAEAPTAEAVAPLAEAAHADEAAAGEQPSGAAQPENSTASQAGEAAASDPVEGA